MAKSPTFKHPLDPTARAPVEADVMIDVEDSGAEDLEARIAQLELQDQLTQAWMTGLRPDLQRAQKDINDLRNKLAEIKYSGQDNSAKNDLPVHENTHGDECCDSESPTGTYKVSTLQHYETDEQAGHHGELEMYGAQDLDDGSFWAPWLTKSGGGGTLAWSKYDQKSLNANETGSLIEIYGWLGATGATPASDDLFLLRDTSESGATIYSTFSQIINEPTNSGAIVTIGDGEWWNLGGTYINCYGQTVGKSATVQVIDLTNNKLTTDQTAANWTLDWSNKQFKGVWESTDTTETSATPGAGSFKFDGGVYFYKDISIATGKSVYVGTDQLTIREVELVDHATGEPVVVKILST